MTVEPKIALRLQFLARVVRKECQHLAATDQRLFGGLFTIEHATRLAIPDEITLEIETLVEPEKNTSMMGLFVSNGNFFTQCEAGRKRWMVFAPLT